MVKKKYPEQDPGRHSETADNEAYNSIGEDAGQTESAIPPEEDYAEKTEDPDKGEGKASDKTEREELSPEEKLAVMQDKYLRLSAEFDNYRKRSLREKMDMSKYASEDVLLKLFPVMDDFERALANMETATECSAIKSGIDLIYSKLTDFLKQNEVKEIESLNCSFNVDLHDAVAKTAVEDESKKGLIVDVIKKGYFLKDKVIRHAKVVIGE